MTQNMVSPVRIRVPPLTKVLQMRCTGSVSVTAETVTPPDSPAKSIYITSTSPGAQCSAMVCKPGRRNLLRHEGFEILCNTRQRPLSPLQEGGRWFEPSITHSKKRVFAGKTPHNREGRGMLRSPLTATRQLRVSSGALVT